MELRSIEDADRADEIIKEIEKLDGVILPKPDQGLDFDSTVDEDDDE
jgi:hypothetical protein